eukprot:8961-Heterococcus_DN1.PRE.2
MVQHYQSRVTSIDALERKLEETGYSVGIRVLELQNLRERGGKRKTRLLQILQWVSADVWRSLFGKTADSLERSTENADEFMIHEMQPLTNAFVSVPADLGQRTYQASLLAYWTAQALCIERNRSVVAVLTATVTAHTIDIPQSQTDGHQSSVNSSSPYKTKTVFLVKFDQEVMRREAQLT